MAYFMVKNQEIFHSFGTFFITLNHRWCYIGSMPKKKTKSLTKYPSYSFEQLEQIKDAKIRKQLEDYGSLQLLAFLIIPFVLIFSIPENGWEILPFALIFVWGVYPAMLLINIFTVPMALKRGMKTPAILMIIASVMILIFYLMLFEIIPSSIV